MIPGMQLADLKMTTEYLTKLFGRIQYQPGGMEVVCGGEPSLT